MSASSAIPISALPDRRRYRVGPMVLFISTLCAAIGLCCWLIGGLEFYASWQIGLLLASLCLLNLTPFMLEAVSGKIDPFDPKHIFLAYFFIVFTFHSLCRLTLGIGTPAALEIPDPSPDLHVRALAAMLVGLSAFVSFCYIPVGRALGQIVPKLPVLDRRRSHLAAFSGIFIGLVAFYLLMRSAGGVRAFLADLGSWRTNGVIAGVGYLTLPIAILLPASALLLLLQHLPAAPQRLTWRAGFLIVIYLMSLAPVIVLGFRGNLLPAILQFLAVWHYSRRRMRLATVGALAALLLLFLSAYGVLRSIAGGEDRQAGAFANAVLFRVPGLDTVERVIWHLDQGVIHRGAAPGFTEAFTILIPRSLWSGKPEPANLAFADIFFLDFFLGRGDPLDGVRSGVSPTLIAELLWIQGLPALILGAGLLGTMAAAIRTWRERAPDHPMHNLVAAILMSWFAIFVEAPQNTFNTFVMLATLCLLLAILLTLRIRLYSAIRVVFRIPGHKADNRTL